MDAWTVALVLVVICLSNVALVFENAAFARAVELTGLYWAGSAHHQHVAALGVVGSTLREHHVIAVVAALVISFGVKMFFLSAPTAEANIHHAILSASVNVLQMQRDVDTKSLPLQKVNDKTFIFADEE